MNEDGFDRDQSRPPGRNRPAPGDKATRPTATRRRLSTHAARLFAARGYHGTSVNDLAVAMGIHKSSVYAHIEGKEDLLGEIALAGAATFHAALDQLASDASPRTRLELALRAHLGIVQSQLDVATVWLQEWRHLGGEPRERFIAERRRYERRVRSLIEAAIASGDLRRDLDVKYATIIFLSAANWAYEWLTEDIDVERVTRTYWSMLADGMAPQERP
jgi:TetR/AcrR family transcriptional regulator, cholesterol catabolism regulator